MSRQLEEALAGAPVWEIERDIRATHEELLPLRRQVAELELLIARAYAKSDPTGYWVPWPPLTTAHRSLTLHKAMEDVLAKGKNQPMTVGEITRAIARRGLYRRRDGLPPTVRDVSARVCTYPALFKRVGWYIKLRMMPPPNL